MTLSRSALLSVCLLGSLTQGLEPRSLRESWQLFQARQAQERGDLAEALGRYRKLHPAQAPLLYNQGNLLYRLGRYREAAALYRQIEAPELQHARYHNLGNCMMRLGQINAAIPFYRAALKFADDPDTQANLRIARRLLEAKTRRQSGRRREEAPDLRPGSVEASSDWQREDFDDSALGEAAIHDRTRRQNLARSGTAQRSKIEALASQGSRTRSDGPSGTAQNSVALRHWKRKMEQGRLRTLLLPISSQGEPHVSHPW